MTACIVFNTVSYHQDVKELTDPEMDKNHGFSDNCLILTSKY